MDKDASAPAVLSTRPRLYGIVQTYIQRQLPRDIYPALKALRDREEAAIASPQLLITGDTTLPLIHGSRIDQIGAVKDHDEHDDDLPLYVASQIPFFFMIDGAK